MSRIDLNESINYEGDIKYFSNLILHTEDMKYRIVDHNIILNDVNNSFKDPIWLWNKLEDKLGIDNSDMVILHIISKYEILRGGKTLGNKSSKFS
jgi:hypothetical protein